MAEELYLEPSSKARFVFLLILVLAGALQAFTEPVIDSLALEKPRFDNLILLERIVIGFEIFLFLVLTVYLARLGHRTFKFQRFPPPGTTVVRRTRVRLGRVAVLAGWSCFLFAAIVMAMVVVIGYSQWLLERAL